MLASILLEIKKMGTRQFIKLTIYMLICVLARQCSCQSDEIKSHDNILVVVAHPDEKTLISETLAKFVDI
jgi:hypothetical protein